jgi:hypothetical protein
MSSQSQISATISEATKERLDRFTESHGLKKNFVVEQALLYFMEARRELPDEALVPARLVVEDKAFDRIAELVTSPPAPTKALRELMRGEGRLRSARSPRTTTAAAFRAGSLTSTASSSTTPARTSSSCTWPSPTSRSSRSASSPSPPLQRPPSNGRACRAHAYASGCPPIHCPCCVWPVWASTRGPRVSASARRCFGTCWLSPSSSAIASAASESSPTPSPRP